MMRNRENIIRIVRRVVMGCSRPIFCPNSREVNFNNIKPPPIMPEDWQLACNMLINLASPSSFKDKASRAISWRLRAK